MAYVIPDPLPWTMLAVPLAAAEDALARLDERLGSSPIREGWVSRTHFLDACASLWLQGELVHLEDLVLHDAGMDQRAPTHELTGAHAVLRTRRRIASTQPGWATSPLGLAALSKGREEDGEGAPAHDPAQSQEPEEERAGEGAIDDDAFAAQLAAIDVLLERSTRVLAGSLPPRAQDPLALVYDLDWDEADRLEAWRRGVEDTRALPPLLAAAVAFDGRLACHRAAAAPALARGLGGFEPASSAGQGTFPSALL